MWIGEKLYTVTKVLMGLIDLSCIEIPCKETHIIINISDFSVPILYSQLIRKGLCRRSTTLILELSSVGSIMQQTINRQISASQAGSCITKIVVPWIDVNLVV